MGGLRYESLADMPAGMRSMATAKITVKAIQVAGKSKYHNQKTVVNGITFDSAKEANRYRQLLVYERAGIIRDLRLQQEFTLKEAFVTAEGERVRAIRYRADFTYRVSMGLFQTDWDKYFVSEDLLYYTTLLKSGGDLCQVIEDVKGVRTDTYKMKYKMMEDLGFQIREI